MRYFTLLLLMAASGLAQTPLQEAPYQVIDGRNGAAKACSGCSIYTYAAGTTTPQSTYTDASLSVQLPNPVLTNSAGYAVSGANAITGIWVGNACYKIVLKDAAAVTVTTQDHVCSPVGLIINLLAASSGAGLVGYSQSVTYPAGTVGARLERVINIADAPYSTLANGTDQSTEFQSAVNAACANGGNSGLLIPGQVGAATIYNVQNIDLHSCTAGLTLYSNSQSTKVQKPAKSGSAAIFQIFTTANGTGAGQPVSNIHFVNFTIDGNKANQTGLSGPQDGLYGIFLGGCTNCSIENMVIENNYTDGVVIGGYGQTTVTGIINTSEVAISVTEATWSQGYATYTTASAHNFAGSPFPTITGITPSGYNQGPCQGSVIDTTHFICALASDPGSYISGGSETTSTVTYVSGTDFSTFGVGLSFTTGSGSCFVTGIFSPSVLYCSTDQGTHSGLAYTTPSVIGVGDNVTISGNLITGNQRNGISHLAGTRTSIIGNHISYTNGLPDGPWDGIDVEPDELGAYLTGSQYVNNELDHNANFGMELGVNDTFMPAFSPVIIDNYVHDNTVGGVRVLGNGNTPAPAIISGTFINNGQQGVKLNWNNAPVTIPWIYSVGSTTALDVEGPFSAVTVGAGILNGGTYDIADGLPPQFGNSVVTGATMANGTVLGIDTLVSQNFYGNPNAHGGYLADCISFWPPTSPRTGAMDCSSYSSVIDNGGTNPQGVRTSDGTVTVKVQLVTGSNGFIGTESNHPMVIASHNATIGVAGALTIYPNGYARLGAVASFSALTACTSANQFSIAMVPDSSTNTWGATITGSGSDLVLAFCDGTNWTVAGK